MHPLFMHPNSIGRSTAKHTTYIQNNFYGNSGGCQNIWNNCGNRVMMRPQYYYPNQSCGMPFMSYMPHWVQNAATRLMSFNLIQSMLNPAQNLDASSQYRDLYLQPQQLLTGNQPTSEELAEVDRRYEAQG